jgi:lipoprotein Spr
MEFVKLLKTTLSLFILAVMAVSCNPAKRLTTRPTEGSDRPVYRGHDNTSGESKRVYKGTRGVGNEAYPGSDRRSGNIENSSGLQFKYSVITNAPVEELVNLNLLNYIEEWYGVPYRYGGSTKTGVDCSAFSMGLMASAFGVPIPRTVREQYERTERVEKIALQQGDLVFFNTTGGISHVGIYLVNNKFVHASTSSGVMISDLEEDYYSRKYVGAGRPK